MVYCEMSRFVHSFYQNKHMVPKVYAFSLFGILKKIHVYAKIVLCVFKSLNIYFKGIKINLIWYHCNGLRMIHINIKISRYLTFLTRQVIFPLCILILIQ